MLMGVVVLLLAPQAMAGMLIGSTLDAIYDIDQTTGVASNPRSLGSRALAIEFADGILYGAAGRDFTTIDPASGASHALGTVTGLDRFESIYDLSWNPQTKTLYAVAHLGGWNIDRLYTIDVVSLAAAFVGELDSAYETLAFDMSGTLYTINPHADALALIDPGTGATLSSILLSPIRAATMAFGDRNKLIVNMDIDGDPSLVFYIDPVDGAFSSVGATGLGGFTSLAYIPEPESFLFLLLGIGLCLMRRAGS